MKRKGANIVSRYATHNLLVEQIHIPPRLARIVLPKLIPVLGQIILGPQICLGLVLASFKRVPFLFGNLDTVQPLLPLFVALFEFLELLFDGFLVDVGADDVFEIFEETFLAFGFALGGHESDGFDFAL